MRQQAELILGSPGPGPLLFVQVFFILLALSDVIWLSLHGSFHELVLFTLHRTLPMLIATYHTGTYDRSLMIIPSFLFCHSMCNYYKAPWGHTENTPPGYSCRASRRIAPSRILLALIWKCASTFQTYQGPGPPFLIALNITEADTRKSTNTTTVWDRALQET